MFKTMLKLKADLDMDGIVIRYKGFVLVAEFVAGPSGELWEVRTYQPIETEEETGEEFHNLRLENITEWEGQRFDTEGEALMFGMQFIEQFVEWRF